MSPEALRCNRISKESDIWSYGVLLWEIFTYGCIPYPSIQPDEILLKLTSGYRMEKPKECTSYIYENIMIKCWEYEPKKRPLFNELVKMFKNLLEKPEYVNVNYLLKAQLDKENSSAYFLKNQSKRPLSTTSTTANSASGFYLSSSSDKSNQAYRSTISVPYEQKTTAKFKEENEDNSANGKNKNSSCSSKSSVASTRDSMKEAFKNENLLYLDNEIKKEKDLSSVIINKKSDKKKLITKIKNENEFLKKIDTDKFTTNNNPIYLIKNHNNHATTLV
jgi:serine/threonine protein kinase